MQVGDFVKDLLGSVSSTNMNCAGNAIIMCPPTMHSIQLSSASKPSSPESVQSVHISPVLSTHHPKLNTGRDMFAVRTVW